MKKIGIIDADLLDNGTRHPNLVCMKLSAYYKRKNYKVYLLEDYSDLEKYHLIFISKVFSFTNVPEIIYENNKCINRQKPEEGLKKHIRIGGTGFYFENAVNLPDEIEHIMPDYSLYNNYINKKIENGEPAGRYRDYTDFSIGFATRGCFRKCDFCVNKKYNKVFKHSPISEFVDHSRPKIYLWDDNFMASSDFDSILDELIILGKPFQFRQGLDVRLMTESKAAKLATAKYYGDFIFAFDHIKDKDLITKKLKIWRKYSLKSTKLYVLTGYESQDIIDIENTFERIKILMEHGCIPYIMRYEEYKKSELKNMYIQLARWCNQPSFYKKKSFRQYCEANENYHRKNTKNVSKNCLCYQTMLDFENSYPEIAKKYFDLRFDELNMYKIK